MYSSGLPLMYFRKHNYLKVSARASAITRWRYRKGSFPHGPRGNPSEPHLPDFISTENEKYVFVRIRVLRVRTRATFYHRDNTSTPERVSLTNAVARECGKKPIWIFERRDVIQLLFENTTDDDLGIEMIHGGNFGPR